MLARRLPGLYFANQSPPLDEALPRMDVAIFVGFASTGELDKAVATESIDDFLGHFGPDLPLAWDPERGEWIYAYLAATVRAFFRNGGRRAWVVRIATPGPGAWDNTLFRDARLQGVGVERLLAEAGTLLATSSSELLRSQPLSLFKGLHAALTLDEATLIAAPDLVQRPWVVRPAVDPPLPVPQPPPWRPAWWHPLGCVDTATQVSATQEPLTELPRGYFLNCSLRIIAPPRLTVNASLAAERSVYLPVDTAYVVRWTMPLGAATGPYVYTLQEATRPDFSDVATLYQGNEQQFTLYGRGLGDRYYQVRAEDGVNVSDWSAGLVVRIAPEVQNEVQPASAYSEDWLLQAHTALLQLCAARGDLFALLSLPVHYRAAEAVAYAQKLHNAPALSDQTRSYGALYHPWLVVREPQLANTLQIIPPEGALGGLLARRALDRGAWVAPANETLQAVVALLPPIGASQQQMLYNAQVNMIWPSPRGFLTRSADTLSGDPDLRSINVRRLLSLLRRLALREGVRYVFEPHDAAFRRLVQRSFEGMLRRLFLQGAFAGQSAAQGYQVVVDERLNPPASVDQGRFVVEFRVAPSQPLTFLTVRLVQSHDRLLINEVL